MAQFIKLFHAKMEVKFYTFDTSLVGLSLFIRMAPLIVKRQEYGSWWCSFCHRNRTGWLDYRAGDFDDFNGTSVGRVVLTADGISQGPDKIGYSGKINTLGTHTKVSSWWDWFEINSAVLKIVIE